jgi:calcium/calmodulin-dependent protein kinase I
MKGSEYYKRLATLKFDLHFKEDLPIMAKDFIIKTIALNSNDRMSAY